MNANKLKTFAAAICAAAAVATLSVTPPCGTVMTQNLTVFVK